MNAWNRHGWPGPFPAHWRYGFLSPQRTLRGGAYYLNPRQRAVVSHGVPRLEPYWLVMDFTLASRKSDRQQVVPEGEFALLAMSAVSVDAVTNAASDFAAHLWQVVSERRGYRFTRNPVNFANLLGSGQRPFLFRRPYFTPHLQPIRCQATDLSAAANNNLVQVVLYGVRRVREVG